MAGGWRSVAAVCIALLFIGLAGCGRKTDLVLPQSLVPVPIKDLRYRLDENGVTLQWSYPRKMETGDELAEIDSFEVFRAAMPAGDYCEGCPVRFDEPIVIDGAVLPESGRKKTAGYAEGGLQVGYRYIYKVRSRAQWWYSSRDSNPVSFVWLSPPPVQHLVAVRVPGGIKLAWQAVPDVDLAGYRIYRRDQDAQEPDLIGEVKSSQNQFIDRQPVAAKRWYYSVTAFDTASPANESSPSMEAFMQQQ